MFIFLSECRIRGIMAIRILEKYAVEKPKDFWRWVPDFSVR